VPDTEMRDGSEGYRLGTELPYAPDRCLLSVMMEKAVVI
jgi:hypothetical protein